MSDEVMGEIERLKDAIVYACNPGCGDPVCEAGHKLARIAREQHEQVLALQKEQMDCDEAHLADGEQMRQQRAETRALRERAKKAEALTADELSRRRALGAQLESAQAENAWLREALEKAQQAIHDEVCSINSHDSFCNEMRAALRGGKE